jgi:hypothetical protein
VFALPCAVKMVVVSTLKLVDSTNIGCAMVSWSFGAFVTRRRFEPKNNFKIYRYFT